MPTADATNLNSTAEIRRPGDQERDLYGITHVGKVRKENQDHFLICTLYTQLAIDATSLPAIEASELRGPRLATIGLVADGVGGSDSGSDASRLAAETVMRYVTSTLRSYHTAGSADENVLMKSLTDAVYQAHDVVRAEGVARGEPKPMATTLTLVFAVWPWMYVVQVGDSRCYYFDGATFTQVTRDQTIAQHLVDTGALPKERLASSPFRHVLASVIGGEEALPQVSRVDLRRSGCVLMCSDGLTGHVSNAELEAHIRAMTSCKQLCDTLLQLALDRGGKDNITILAARSPLPKTA